MKRPENDIERTPEMLSRRIMAINFAAIHTSTMTSAAMLLDIASVAEDQRCIGLLRSECTSMSQMYGGTWSRARLRNMHRLDSTIRESMRVSSFNTKGTRRKVMPSEGVELPDGTRVP